jgi:hypothetical protein
LTVARRVSVARPSAGELRGTALFVVVAVAVAALVAFVPHTARIPPLPYRADNGTLSMNWFFVRPSIRPAAGATAYGISTFPVAARAGSAFSVTGSARPTSGSGGSVCLRLVRTIPPSPTPVQTSHVCAPLAAGWTKFNTVTLRTAAPGRVYAEISAYGNDGGFETRAIKITRGAG